MAVCGAQRRWRKRRDARAKVEQVYWVAGQYVTQEIAKWADWATLVSAAHSAHLYVSCATSCPATQCYMQLHGLGCNFFTIGKPHHFYDILRIRVVTVNLTGETSVTGEISKFHRSHR